MTIGQQKKIETKTDGTTLMTLVVQINLSGVILYGELNVREKTVYMTELGHI